MSRRRVLVAIRPLVNARGIQPECARVLHESLMVPVLMYGSEAMIWKEKKGLEIVLYRWTTSEVC